MCSCCNKEHPWLFLPVNAKKEKSRCLHELFSLVLRVLIYMSFVLRIPEGDVPDKFMYGSCLLLAHITQQTTRYT